MHISDGISGRQEIEYSAFVGGFSESAINTDYQGQVPDAVFL